MKLPSFTSLLSIPLFVSTALAQDPGSILFPTPNQTIAPGSNFTFTYFGRADYGVSSYAYSVWLLNSDVVNTSMPSVADLFTEGWYFGRFDYANYPAVPYETHPAPAQLTMPDFSKSLGGWGSGQAAGNVNFTLFVFEEYGDGSGSVGRKLGVASVPVIYNATS